MTKYHGKGIVLWVEDGPSGGSNGTYNISASVNSVDVPRTADEVDVTTFGAGDFRSYLAGFQNATMRIAGFFDDTGAAAPGTANTAGTASGADAVLAAWIAFGTQTRKVIFYPSGTATGKIRYEGTCIPLGYSLNGAVANAVSFTSDLRVTGAITRYTNA